MFLRYWSEALMEQCVYQKILLKNFLMTRIVGMIGILSGAHKRRATAAPFMSEKQPFSYVL